MISLRIKYVSSNPLSLTGSASRTDLSQLANGIWEIHAGCPSFLRVSSVAKIGYIPQFKASNARDQDEVSSDLARMHLILKEARQVALPSHLSHTKSLKLINECVRLFGRGSQL